jgi:hypothetical protein
MFFIKNYRHKKNTLFLANVSIMVTRGEKKGVFQNFFVKMKIGHFKNVQNQNPNTFILKLLLLKITTKYL